MARRRIRWILRFSTLSALLAIPSWSQPPPSVLVTDMSRLAPALRIDEIESAVPPGVTSDVPVAVENELIYVRFSAKREVPSAQGFVEGVVRTQDGAPAPATNSWTVPARTSISEPAFVSGVIAVPAPTAGRGHVVALTYRTETPCNCVGECFQRCGDPIATAEATFDSALVASFRLDRFHVEHPRKKITWVGIPIPTGTDDVWATLSASERGGRSVLSPLAVHVGLTTKGTTRPISGAGPQGDIGVLETPPVIVVPDDSPALSVAYSLANDPDVGGAAGRFFDSLSGAAASVLNIFYSSGTSNWNAVDEFTRQLNDWQYSDCDGFTAADAIQFTGRQLATLTADGRYEETRPYNGTNYEAPAMKCGIGSSDYQVTWRVTRLSAPADARRAIQLTNPVQQIRHGESSTLAIVSQLRGVTWTVEGGATKGSIVDGVLVPAPGVATGDIIVVTAHEVPRGVDDGRSGKFFVGILP